MNQMQLILQIIASCDEALRDAFLRRMDAAVLIAKNKMEQGDAIFNPAQEEAVLRQITFDLAPDLRLRAESLWRNLTRMNRGRQYRYFITNAPDLKLIHEPDMRKDMPAGKILCAARDAAAIEAYLRAQSLFPDTTVRYYGLCYQNLGLHYLKKNM